jgi:hypothetical protein
LELRRVSDKEFGLEDRKLFLSGVFAALLSTFFELLLELGEAIEGFAFGEESLSSLVEGVFDDLNDLFEGVRFGAGGSSEAGNE